jgi:hypothetical protein
LRHAGGQYAHLLAKQLDFGTHLLQFGLGVFIGAGWENSKTRHKRGGGEQART